MFLVKRLFFLCVIGGLFFSSCSSDPILNGSDSEDGVISGGATDDGAADDGINDDDTNDDGKPVQKYKMSFDAVEAGTYKSRASVDESQLNDNMNSVLRWDSGDRINIWTGGLPEHLTSCLFETKSGGLESAKFEYEGERVDSRIYFGYYPYSENLDYNRIQIEVPVDGSICQKVKNSSVHLSPYRPMYTPVVRRDNDSEVLTGLCFNHLTGLLYFRIRNLSGQSANLESVTIRCTDAVFSQNAVLHLSPTEEASFELSGADKSADAVLSFGEGKSGISIENNEIIQAFLPVLPVESFQGSKISLILKVDGKEYISLNLSGNNLSGFKAAYYYRFGLTLRDGAITVDPVIEEWQPGDDIDIPVY